jgi:hypothetical protein
MIHKRTISESITVNELFKNNKVGESSDTIHNVPYELKIKTPYGYHLVPTLVRTIPQISIRIYFTNNTTLECGWEHKLKANGEWKQIKDIDVQNDSIETENGFTKISKIHVGKEKILYDLAVDKVHCFYGNGILSHNTWVLAAIGAAAVRAGKTVVHYSMELSESYVGRRYDTIFTSIPSSELADNRDVVRSKIGKLNGKLMIKYFPPKGVTSRKLEAHIEKMINSGNKPDLVIVDYADLMLSHSSKSDSTYAEQGGIYIDLRGMAGELKLPVWTASQTQRSAVDSEIIEGDKIADSYAKIMNADFVMSVSRRSKDKVSNTARFHIIKNRFGMDGITFPSKMDTHRGVIEVYEADSANGINATKQSEKGELLEKQTLHKKYVDTIGTANVDF